METKLLLGKLQGRPSLSEAQGVLLDARLSAVGEVLEIGARSLNRKDLSALWLKIDAEGSGAR